MRSIERIHLEINKVAGELDRLANEGMSDSLLCTNAARMKRYWPGDEEKSVIEKLKQLSMEYFDAIRFEIEGYIEIPQPE